MNGAAPQVSLVPGRSCEGCTLCCKVIAVPSLDKPRLAWCQHCEIGVGCRIFAKPERPSECGRFYCGYRQRADLGEEWHPNVCHMTISYEGQAKRMNICVDPDHAETWRQEPYYSQIKLMALGMLREGGHLIVWQGADGIGVLPHKDVLLGTPTGDQVIVAGRRALADGGEEFMIAAMDRNDPQLRPPRK